MDSHFGLFVRQEGELLATSLQKNDRLVYFPKEGTISFIRENTNLQIPAFGDLFDNKIMVRDRNGLMVTLTMIKVLTGLFPNREADRDTENEFYVFA